VINRGGSIPSGNNRFARFSGGPAEKFNTSQQTFWGRRIDRIHVQKLPWTSGDNNFVRFGGRLDQRASASWANPRFGTPVEFDSDVLRRTHARTHFTARLGGVEFSSNTTWTKTGKNRDLQI
jgi:hypothetical protein